MSRSWTEKLFFLQATREVHCKNRLTSNGFFSNAKYEARWERGQTRPRIHPKDFVGSVSEKVRGRMGGQSDQVDSVRGYPDVDLAESRLEAFLKLTEELSVLRQIIHINNDAHRVILE